MSEVPLGVFLSGGLDSSVITALACLTSSKKVATFSVGYEDDPASNELPFARQVATHLGTDHHEFILRDTDFIESIPLMVEKMEEPVVETAAIPLYHISRLAKEHATVLLSGEGSDEIFAGYGIYQTMLKLDKAAAWRLGSRLIPRRWIHNERFLKYLDWAECGVEKRYRGVSSDVTPNIKARLYTDNFNEYWVNNDYLGEIFEGYFAKVAGLDLLSKLLYVDTKTWLVDDLLLKADKMTMATSVELRVPFLDHTVVEYAATLPSAMKLHDGEGKLILKKTTESLLPKNIIYRKKKGFPVPTKRWFGAGLVPRCREQLASSWLYDQDIIRKDYVERLLNQHATGKEDHSRRLFSFLVMNQWHQTFRR